MKMGFFSEAEPSQVRLMAFVIVKNETDLACTGRVIIVLKEPMKMRHLRIHFLGQAYNKWTEKKTT